MTYPEVPKMTKIRESVSKNSLEIFESSASGTIISGDTTIVPGNNEAEINRSQVTIRSSTSSKSRGFQDIVLQELTTINLKLNNLMDQVGIVSVSLRNNTEPKHLEESAHHDLTAMLRLLPIQNVEDLATLESLLFEVPNQRLLTIELSRMGGISIKEITRKCLYRLLTNEVGMKYSWEGAKKKLPFKVLRIANIIIDTVRVSFTEATDASVIEFIKLWLVRAKDRQNNLEKKNLDLGNEESVQSDQ